MLGVHDDFSAQCYRAGAIRSDCAGPIQPRTTIPSSPSLQSSHDLKYCSHEICCAGKHATRSTFGAKKNALEHEKKGWLHKDCGTACATCNRLRKDGLLWKSPKERALCRERQRGKRNSVGSIAVDSRGQPRTKNAVVTKVPPVLPAGFSMFAWPHQLVPHLYMRPVIQSRLFATEVAPSSPSQRLPSPPRSSPEPPPSAEISLDATLLQLDLPQAPSLSDLEVLEDLYKAYGLAA